MELGEVNKNILDYINKTLEKNRIKNLVQGREIGFSELLGMIEKGYDLEQIKNYITKNLTKEGKDAFLRVSLKKFSDK